MLKLKKIPKHASLSVNYRYVTAKTDYTKFKRKGRHTAEKYDPRMYLNKTMNFNKEVKVSEPMFYDYQIRVQAPLFLFPMHGNNIVKREVMQTMKQPRSLFNRTGISNNDASIDLVQQSFGANEKLSSSMYSNKRLKFAKEDVPVEEIEKSRRKWGKLLKRTIFSFDINTMDNAVSLVRVKRPDVEDDATDHVKVRTKQEGSNLSPHIQKKKGIEDKVGKNSIKVFYGTGNRSLSKTLGCIEPAVERHAKEMILKTKVKNNLKLELKLKNLIRRDPPETNFDLTKIDLSQIDATSYLHLYLAIKKAVSPTFYSTENEEVNELDMEIVETIQNKPETTLTQYDKDIISLYRSYVSQVNTEEILSGFWQSKKVKGYRPPSRESATLIKLQDNFYLFGGYGVDRMNDLWCLTNEEGFEVNYIWNVIKPLGSKVPEKRYGHCMTTYNNCIYIFGGSSDFITGLKVRVVLGNIWKYSIEENRWEEIDTSIRSYRNRMYAASGSLQDIWIIHGGTDGNPQNVMSSIIAYSFGKLFKRDRN